MSIFRSVGSVQTLRHLRYVNMEVFGKAPSDKELSSSNLVAPFAVLRLEQWAKFVVWRRLNIVSSITWHCAEFSNSSLHCLLLTTRADRHQSLPSPWQGDSLGSGSRVQPGQIRSSVRLVLHQANCSYWLSWQLAEQGNTA